ncbi:alkaline phosphatase D family protein [Alteromonas gilva]|uniref:Alkaline phosphatase D family protein n=1 Tax=Alteromonas gilva TaxID=2987522 RepID=A0ABT5KZE8_9ALTE|nr:alkaline phosphatase D family protein [Alteromonas gilva]MDC8830023.1 alkaline phosphatase D family protein [Alteromonas gilva]
MDRRQFIKFTSAAGSSLLISTGLAGCTATQSLSSDNVRFTHGVASGDPLADAVIIWTRAVPDTASTPVIRWELATDSDFSTIIASGDSKAEKNRDYTVKVDVKGLQPATRYYYRFRTANQLSVTGETMTLPSGHVESVNLAVFSCSNYPAGYFTAYQLAADDASIDYVLHLGDYIYEYSSTGYATEHAQEIGRTLAADNEGEIYTLTDYRNRYATYRNDNGLLALHQRKPFIVVWDDHEIANDTYKAGAENHTPDEGDFFVRRAAAIQAYFEWLPIRPPLGESQPHIYRQFRFGDLVNLYMLDTRVIGRDKQLNYNDYRDADGKRFDTERFKTDLLDPDRSIMGKTQADWFINSLASSQSQAQWQVVGQQLLMARMFFPSAVFTGVPRDQIAANIQRLADLQRRQNTGEVLSAKDTQTLQAKMAYNLDAWDGYPVERERVVRAFADCDKPVIALAGDTHNAWHSLLTTEEGEVAAVELGVSSVSSPGMESYLQMDADVAGQVAEDLPALVTDLQYCNMHQRGYLTVHFTPQKATATWVFVDTIMQPQAKVAATHQAEILPEAL